MVGGLFAAATASLALAIGGTSTELLTQSTQAPACRGRAMLQTGESRSDTILKIQQLAAREHDPELESAAGRTMMALDANRDHKVDTSEVAAFAELQGLDSKKAVTAFAGLDEDGDGALNEAELKTALDGGGFGAAMSGEAPADPAPASVVDASVATPQAVDVAPQFAQSMPAAPLAMPTNTAPMAATVQADAPGFGPAADAAQMPAGTLQSVGAVASPQLAQPILATPGLTQPQAVFGTSDQLASAETAKLASPDSGTLSGIDAILAKNKELLAKNKDLLVGGSGESVMVPAAGDSATSSSAAGVGVEPLSSASESSAAPPATASLSSLGDFSTAKEADVSQHDSALESVADQLAFARAQEAKAEALEKKAQDLRVKAATLAREGREKAEAVAATATQNLVKEIMEKAAKIDGEEKKLSLQAASLKARAKVELDQANDYMRAADEALMNATGNQTAF